MNGSMLPGTALDIVEQMDFLFIKVFNARGFIAIDGPYIANPQVVMNPYVIVKVGRYKVATKYLKSSLDCAETFAFKEEQINGDEEVEILLKDGAAITIGKVSLLISDAIRRDSVGTSYAPHWYVLKDRNNRNTNMEVNLTYWMGTQADAEFATSWHSDSAVDTCCIPFTRSRQYHSPILCYLRVSVNEAVLRGNNGNGAKIYVKATLGDVAKKTKVSSEPFDGSLVLTVKVQPNANGERSVIIGSCTVPMENVQKREDDAPVVSNWYNLVGPEGMVGKLHMGISLDGGYHVFDEPIHYSSDFRPTANSGIPSIGVLHLGILNAAGLRVMKPMENRTDAYCVAKYGSRWVRTRTILDSVAPQWNEQFSWPVYELYTVLCIAVFDNCHLHGGPEALHQQIGKIRIRLSTLEVNRVYTFSYPLAVTRYSKVKKMGEIQLAVRLSSSTSLINRLRTYSQPLLPKMQCSSTLSEFKLDKLKNEAASLIVLSLARDEPPLRKEVISYMLDVGVETWSLQKAIANYDRVRMVVIGFLDWFENIRKRKLTMIFVYASLLIAILIPNMLLPTIFLCLIGAWLCQYRKRPRLPPDMHIKLTGIVINSRYDQLRVIGRMQTALGELATLGERVESLLSWRDSLGECALRISLNLKLYESMVARLNPESYPKS
ncbi:FT-interacting protein 3-like [Quercus robur]|uniref:FT-interacting protein 3-like n=1 Tax=Quercus robur TaxID=38942 RepID=UPI00216306D4|nr:FT-interacting protein 3-like [Quercus robur]